MLANDFDHAQHGGDKPYPLTLADPRVRYHFLFAADREDDIVLLSCCCGCVGSCWGNCRDFWNCGSCTGPSLGLELTVPYYMYDIYKVAH